jgi:protein-disulfide isomerase
MYTAQDDEGDKGFGDADSINKLTGTISGIETPKVVADVAANKDAYDALIEADKAEAGKVGVQATPSFVIGTEVIGGAYPFARFQTAIDALLK